MARTYLPTLILLARKLATYATRWYAVICPNCTTAQVELLDQLIVALNALIAAVEIATGE